jgi:hypothetical protein
MDGKVSDTKKRKCCVAPKPKEDCQNLSYPLSYGYKREANIISEPVVFDFGER